MFGKVLPLSRPATENTLSKVPPFISDELLCTELSRHGKIASPIKKVFFWVQITAVKTCSLPSKTGIHDPQ